MFVSITFVAFSFSGNLIFTEEDVLKVALPTFCEVKINVCKELLLSSVCSLKTGFSILE